MNTIFVINKTGGVGKTTLTELLYARLYIWKYAYQAVAIDSDEDSEAKLSDRLKNVIQISAEFSDETDDGVSRFIGAVSEKNCIVDFGANVFSKFKKKIDGYALSSFLYGRKKPIVFIPVTSDRRSLKDAISVVEYFSNPENDLHASQIYIVKNLMSGKFDLLSEFDDLILKSAVPIDILQLGKVRESKILDTVYDLKKPMEFFAFANAENAVRIFPELDPVRARRYASVMHRFVKGFFEELDCVKFSHKL